MNCHHWLATWLSVLSVCLISGEVLSGGWLHSWSLITGWWLSCRYCQFVFWYIRLVNSFHPLHIVAWHGARITAFPPPVSSSLFPSLPRALSLSLSKKKSIFVELTHHFWLFWSNIDMTFFINILYSRCLYTQLFQWNVECRNGLRCQLLDRLTWPQRKWSVEFDNNGRATFRCIKNKSK